MKQPVLVIAAAAEVATGAALLVTPAIVTQLLFGEEVSGVGAVASRVAGIALIALGISCWPTCGSTHAHCGMLTYSALVTVYLASLGIEGRWVGRLLWPGVVLHAVLTILLVREWLIRRRAPRPDENQ